MNPEQVMVPIERGRDAESYLVMMNSLLDLTLGSIYLAESAMRPADPMLFTFIWEETDRAECGFFCGVELFVLIQ